MLADAVRRTEAPPPPPPPPPAPPPPERHVAHRVAAGETMSEVASRYSTNVDTLKAANPDVQDADQLDAGQLLQVPIGEAYGREPTATQVQPGQTMADLARQVNLPLQRLVDA